MKYHFVHKTALALMVFGLFFTACNPSKPVSEETMETILKTVDRADSIRKLDRSNLDTANVIISNEMAKLDLSLITLEQINAIGASGRHYKYNALRKAFLPSLLRLSTEPTLEGCKAAAISTVNFPKAEAEEDKKAKNLEWAETYMRFVTHPAIGEFMLKDGSESSYVFGRLQFLDPKAVVESGLLDALLPLLSMPSAVSCGAGAIFVFTVASDKEAGLSNEKIQEVRALVLAKTEEVLSQVRDGESKGDKRQATHLNKLVTFLNGPAAKGLLIGNTAPEIHFTHTLGLDAEKLSELKGNVVIIDFWATWCSPCVASFPNIRALKERYKNYPVKIIGVTSLQGAHTDPIAKKRTKVKPDEEYNLMGKFMTDLDMTWAVAFSKQSQFNTDFGVRGIPHVAIVDANGIVRYNKLRPYNAPYHEAEKIDALLKEAGLPFPKKAMDQTNYAKL